MVVELPTDSTNILASPSKSSNASSPEGFAGFHENEMKNDKIDILNALNKPAMRVSQPRRSKSRASLVWQKKGRNLTDSIKEEPKETSANTKKTKTCVILDSNKGKPKEASDNTDKIMKKGVSKVSTLKGKNFPIKQKQGKNMMTKVVEKIPIVEIKKLPIIQNRSNNMTEIEQIPTSSSMANENMIGNLEAIKKKIRRKRHNQNLNGFKCNQCGKNYRYLRGLNQHRRLECNKGPQFPCPYCPSKYRYRQNIREHVRSCHELAFPRWYATHYVVPHMKKNIL